MADSIHLDDLAGRFVIALDALPEAPMGRPHARGRTRRGLVIAALAVAALAVVATQEPLRGTAGELLERARSLFGMPLPIESPRVVETPVLRSFAPVTTPAPFAPDLVSFSLVGRITDENGLPISGAIVSVGGSIEGTTDASGAYQLDLETERLRPAVGYVYVKHPGFESVVNEVLRSMPVTSFDVRLRRELRMAAGDSVHLEIASDDAICYSSQGMPTDPLNQWSCRIVRVSTPSTAGTLVVDVVPDDGLGVGLQLIPSDQANTMPLEQVPCCGRHQEIRPFYPGIGVTVEVLGEQRLSERPAPGPRVSHGLTLRTAFIPDPPFD